MTQRDILARVLDLALVEHNIATLHTLLKVGDQFLLHSGQQDT